MKRLAGTMLGLSLLMPTLHYQTRLFEQVTRALDGEQQLSLRDMTPPVNVTPVLDKITTALRSR